jgi:osmotically-inducible protein OsmY
MTTATHTDTDIQIRDAVERWLDWDAEVDATGIGVAAQEGIVTLTGTIDTYAGKLAAERAAKRVAGVRGIANDLEVRLMLDRSDVDIARDAVDALSLLSAIPQGIQAIVHKGYVTLTGNVHWIYQKQHAERAVRHVRGVRGVFNHVLVTPPATAGDVRQRIVKALQDDADVDARHVTVTVSANTAKLNGTVSSWLQRESAERAAASAPGITHVDNQIRVEPRDWGVEQDLIC